MMADFDDIKVGQFVIITGSRKKDRVVQVTRVLPKSFEAGGARYWKKNGKNTSTHDAFYTPYAIPYDPDHGEKIAEAEYRDEFVRSMRTRKWHDVSTDAMRKIFKILGDEKLRNLT